MPVAHAGRLPRPDHIVVVIMENRGYSQIMDMRNGNSYIHALARRGVLFTQSYGVTHPSQPKLSGTVFRCHATHHQQRLPEHFQHRQPRLDFAGCGLGALPVSRDVTRNG